MITDAMLDTFLAKAQDVVDRDYDKFMPQPRIVNGPTLSIEKGRRYAKIVATDDNGRGRRVWGFIDMTNGEVLKAASWKAPAKNFPRGNLNDASGGVGRAKWTGIG